MTDETTTRQSGRRPYAVGTKVEIRNRFDASWTDGFEIAEVTDGGSYRVRRSSDGSILPVEFQPEDVRRLRRQGMWWI